MSKNDRQLKFLLQTDFRDFVKNYLGKNTWVELYSKIENDTQDTVFFSALIPNEKISRVLNDPSWDLSIGDGLPGCSVYYENDGQVIRYHRFGDDDGIEPIVIVRTFHGIKPSYIEILEEFRLFHDLYYDTKNNVYIKVDDYGNEEEIIKVDENAVKIKLKALKQFLAIKEMYLAIFFDSVCYSQLKFEEIDPVDAEAEIIMDDLTYTFHIAESHFDRRYNVFSRLLGKKLIPGLPKEKSGIWPYTETKDETKYETFIIGVDEDGDNVTHVCMPDHLANYFGANPDAPHYLTPVFFRREVLNKYFSNPEKFSIEDGFLRCGGLWGLEIDNNHEQYVCVFLGDLGQKLSYEEQLYWKSFNIPPDGSISTVNLNRNFLNQFTDPEQIDLLFKYRFTSFQRNWQEKFGWPLFKPLSEGDSYLYTALRLPLVNSQAEFDSQVLALTKLLVDSLNEKQLAKRLSNIEPNSQGITKFDNFLESHNITDRNSVISFLRNLQNLRSAGVGHRKSKNYKKISALLGMDEKDLITVFKEILVEAINSLDILEVHFLTKDETEVSK